MRRALESLVDSDTAEILEPIPERAFGPQDASGSCKTAGLFSQSPEDEAEEKTTGIFPQSPEDETDERTTGLFPQTPEDEAEERTTSIFQQSPEDEAEERTIGLFSQNPAETEEQTSGISSQNQTGKEGTTTGKNAKKTNEYQNVDLGTVQKTDRNVRKHQTSTDAPNSSFIKLLFFKGGIGKREKFLSCVFWLSLLQIISYAVLPYIKDYSMYYSSTFSDGLLLVMLHSIAGGISTVRYGGVAISTLIFSIMILHPIILITIVLLTSRKIKKRNLICIYVLNLIFAIFSFMFLGTFIVNVHYYFALTIGPGIVLDAAAILSKIVLSIVFFKSIFKGEKEHV